jgi:methyl-accepting chemotaxis protein
MVGFPNVSLLAMIFSLRYITRPLQALGRQARRLAWGDFSATETLLGGVAEIEDLRFALDQMADQNRGIKRVCGTTWPSSPRGRRRDVVWPASCTMTRLWQNFKWR